MLMLETAKIPTLSSSALTSTHHTERTHIKRALNRKTKTNAKPSEKRKNTQITYHQKAASVRKKKM